MPEEDVFHRLVASMTTALNSWVKATFYAAAFLQQVRHESFVSHLPSSTHASVKHALLLPSTSTLFDEEVIMRSLTQVRDDSQLSLLKNLSSLKGGKHLAPTASSLGPRQCNASPSSSSSCSQSFSRGSRGSKRPSSSSPGRRLEVAFKGMAVLAGGRRWRCRVGKGDDLEGAHGLSGV